MSWNRPCMVTCPQRGQSKGGRTAAASWWSDSHGQSWSRKSSRAWRSSTENLGYISFVSRCLKMSQAVSSLSACRLYAFFLCTRGMHDQSGVLQIAAVWFTKKANILRQADCTPDAMVHHFAMKTVSPLHRCFNFDDFDCVNHQNLGLEASDAREGLGEKTWEGKNDGKCQTAWLNGMFFTVLTCLNFDPLSSQVACRGACLFGATMTQSRSSASNWNSGRRLQQVTSFKRTDKCRNPSHCLKSWTNQFNFHTFPNRIPTYPDKIQWIS